MVFKVTFVDGSVEIINASTPGEARRYAVQKFRDRLAAKVERAGLTDMAIQRPQGMQKPQSHGN
jgi:hypothetical protein